MLLLPLSLLENTCQTWSCSNNNSIPVSQNPSRTFKIIVIQVIKVIIMIINNNQKTVDDGDKNHVANTMRTLHTHIYMYTWIFIYVYIYIYLYVCMYIYIYTYLSHYVSTMQLVSQIQNFGAETLTKWWASPGGLRQQRWLGCDLGYEHEEISIKNGDAHDTLW